MARARSFPELLVASLALVCCAEPPKDGALVPGYVSSESREDPTPARPAQPDVVRTIPTLLIRIGEASGCRVPQRRPGGESGPPAWILELPDQAGYAAWCEVAATAEGRYGILVALTSKQHPWASCAPYLPMHEHEPPPYFEVTALPSSEIYPIDLSEYWYVAEDSWWNPQPVASRAVPTGPALHIHFGGAGNLMLCRANRWIMTGYH